MLPLGISFFTLRTRPEIASGLDVPPYSILPWKLEHDRDPERLRRRLNFSARLFERLTALPNVRVSDFRDAAEITHDLHRYKEMTHFDASVAIAIAQSIAADRYRVEPADPRPTLRRLAMQAAAYRVPGGASSAAK
jgi:hypothetical protein